MTRTEYTLILYVDGKEIYESGFMTLQQIDRETKKYKNQKELALAMQQKFNINSRNKQVEVKIGYYYNKEKKQRDTNTYILYQDDSDFVEDPDQYKTLYTDLYTKGNSGERQFALSTVQRYIDRTGFKSSVLEINNGYNVLENFIDIDEKLSGYRSCRNKYIFYWEYKTGERRYNYDGTFKSQLVLPDDMDEPRFYEPTGDPYLDDLLGRLSYASPDEIGEIRDQIANHYGTDYLSSLNVSTLDGTGHGSK